MRWHRQAVVSAARLGLRPACWRYICMYIACAPNLCRPSMVCHPQCLDTSSWELTDVALEQPQEQQQQQQQRRPPGRHSHVAGLYEDRGLIIFGGAGLRGPLADVWTFQPSSSGAADGSASAPSGSWRCLSGDLADDQGPERREMVSEGCTTGPVSCTG